MTVGHMRTVMSEREFRDWAAYYRWEYEKDARDAIMARNKAKRKGR